MDVNVKDAERAQATCIKLWTFFNDRKWDEAKNLLSEEFEAFWPKSKEKIIGPNNFIELNRRYPGTHEIKVLNNMYEWDQWEQTFSVSTQVSIHSKLPDNEELNLFAISFFELDHEGLIKSATEYWGDT